MPATNLDTLQHLGPRRIQSVVRDAAGRRDLQVTEFSVDVLSDQGVTSQDSLFLLRGQALTSDSRQPWALVVKVIPKPVPDADPGDLWFLHREVEVYQSGLLTSMSARLRAPRVYAVTPQGDQVWVWLEYVQEPPGRTWTPRDYAHAARQLGEWHGRTLTGQPLPDFPWLLRDLARQWSSTFGPATGELPSGLDPSFTPELRARILHAWERRAFYLSVLRRLPPVFSHFDFHRRNLLMQEDEVIALDWAWCGIGPVGGDLVSLVGSTCMFGDWDVDRIGQLDAVVAEAYAAGLRQAGWSGDARLARLGYAAWMPLHFGVVAPALVDFWTSDARQARAAQLFGGTPGELAARWAALCDWSLARGEEALALWADMTGETVR